VSLSDAEIMQEIDSWRAFGDALKGEDRELFNQMIRTCYEFIPSMHAKDSPFSAEALFMGLLFAQHRKIAQLSEEAAELRKKGT
jgi:hypothetical protein